MSNTFKHKKKGYVNALEKTIEPQGWFLSNTHEDALNNEYKRKYGNTNWWDDVYGYNYYSKDPSWWRSCMMERPARRKTKILCRELEKANDLAEEVADEIEAEFPLARKPHIYYW